LKHAISRAFRPDSLYDGGLKQMMGGLK
jgi:hypothetical protein